MSKENNLTDFLTDVADAIREKKGTADKINPQNFSDEIKGIKTSSSIWTGHVDVEGLKAIGWDDEDIAYFQEHGVNWMEEDDEYHKVSDDNKALYGILTADNIQEYKDRIVWLPKIDFSEKTNMSNVFNGCVNMVGIPMMDTSNVIYFERTFYSCRTLTCCPPLNFRRNYTTKGAFEGCYSLLYVGDMDESSVQINDSMFKQCFSLRSIPNFKWDSVAKERGNQLFYQCYSITYIPKFKDYKISSTAFRYTYALVEVKIEGLLISLLLNESSNISKESILYVINNETATEAITITIHAVAYARLSTDPDIVAALENHPLVSLASA